MAQDRGYSSGGFEPPKYLASLIAAVNDGAKAAQGGALLFALVGVYLLATAFSASDEDLLRGRTVTISQIGATLPVSFSFAIAPFVFVFLHIYTLARYDMLAANVRQFLAELHRTVRSETDRERCRQLLANVEFIQALIAPPGSRLYSPVWRWLVQAVVAAFPVVVLMLVEINALRYQSELITRVQQLGVLLDLSALVWFFHRVPLGPSAQQRGDRLAEPRRWAKLLWLPVIVMGLNLVYMNVVPTEADVRLVRYEARPTNVRDKGPLAEIRQYLADALDNPLDVLLCPSLKWGCRYLRVDNRTLVDHVWDDKAMADLRRSGADQAKLAAIEGLVLRDRSLRFAVLDESSLLAADLIGADLRKASLVQAQLPGAKLYGSATKLQGADLTFAQLQGANLGGAQLQGAYLFKAQLQGADLSAAQLQGADLSAARLWRASFTAQTELGLSDLQGADFTTPLKDDEVRALRASASLSAIPDANMKAAAEERLGRLLWADQSADQLRFTASPERQVLVSDPKASVFADISVKWLITSPTPAYTSALVALLADELASHPAIASGIAYRAAFEIRVTTTDDWRRSLYVDVACRLLANAGAKRVKLEQRSIDGLSQALHDRKIECEPAKPAALR
jgi:Pentapeptide repeats (8 copies)